MVSVLWRLGCSSSSTHVELVEVGDAGLGEGEGRGLVFPNFSDRGGGGSHLCPTGDQLTFSQRLGWF